MNEIRYVPVGMEEKECHRGFLKQFMHFLRSLLSRRCTDQKDGESEDDVIIF